MNIRRNLTRLAFADTYAVEFVMAIVAISVAYGRISFPEDRTLASVVILTGAIRIVAVVLNSMWLRLAISYAAVFSWVYFIMFVFLDQPSPHLPGGIVGAIANAWVAWRLQSESHMRKDLINDGR